MTMHPSSASAPLLLALLVLVTAGAEASSRDKVCVSLKLGAVEGSRVSSGRLAARQFLGIPFAEPPVGPLRLARPKPRSTNWGRLVATRAPLPCVQPDLPAGVAMSEDCLYLNVWAPAGDRVRLPVMVWIHGGSFVRGSASVLNGAVLAALGQVVVVAPQYRLGALGFLRLSDSEPGNWGLWDQRLALQWVRDNIAAFGGDPDAITVFGESAGSASVALHMLSADSARLFRRAILQSGVVNNPWAYNPNAKGMQDLQSGLVSALGCRGNEALTCLRAQSKENILGAQKKLRMALKGAMVWVPLMDGAFLPKDPEQVLQSGGFAAKDLMIGATDDEGGNLAWWAVRDLLKAFNLYNPEMTSLTARLMPSVVGTVLQYYPRPPTRTKPALLQLFLMRAMSRENANDGILNMRRMSDAAGGLQIYCGLNKFVDAYAAGGRPVYMYEFAHRPSISTDPVWIGAGHAAELPFVFGLPLMDRARFTQGEVKLSRAMVLAWTAFARNGRPGVSTWPAFTQPLKEYFQFAVPSSHPSLYGLRRDQCYFWDQVVPFVNKLATPSPAAKKQN